jgi:glycosyltransferase involved in cell wall biosynthesis
MSVESTIPAALQASVIVPARNEEACLAACLRSLSEQAGVNFEIIVVDDASTDRTGEIAKSFPQVRVVHPPALPPGWSGKVNAVEAGAAQARGAWLLFTDADTVHLPGSLARAITEAEKRQAALLSYSPEQQVRSFWEKAVMPVVFAELASRFRPVEVSNPRSAVAAANGQYLFPSRFHDSRTSRHDNTRGSFTIGSSARVSTARLTGPTQCVGPRPRRFTRRPAI